MKLVFIILLIILMVFYGGQNKLDRIEYSKNYFKNINNLILYEKKIHKLVKDDPNIPVEDITNKLNVEVIPNLEKVFYIDIESKKSYTLDKTLISKNIMIIFNHSNSNLYLEINGKYLYKLNDTMSIVDCYTIYNDSLEKAVITLFLVKKPFWYSS
jgi:hypothetical protein